MVRTKREQVWTTGQNNQLRGRIPDDRRGLVSSVLVVMPDNKDLFAGQLWAFVDFRAGPLKDELEKGRLLDSHLIEASI